MDVSSAGGDAVAHDDWMDAFFASYYAHRPVNATFIGVHDFDDRLPDFSDAGVGDVLADMGRLLDATPVPDAELDRVQTMDQRLARGFLEIQEWEYTSGHFQAGNPSLYTGEAVFGIIGLLLTEFAPIGERLEAATARMAAIPDFLAQARVNVSSAPSAWTERAMRECDGALALFTNGVARLAADVAPTVHSRALAGFAAAAERAARAFSHHRTWLATQLLARAHDRYSCGPEALDLYLRRGHFLEEDADEIVRAAESALAEAESYLAAHAADFGAASPEEAIARLADDAPSAEGYYDRYREIWDDVRALSEEKQLVTWPEFPIRYVPRPEWIREAAPYLYFLYYRSPPAFNRPDVHDYLVAPLPDGDPTELLRAHNDSVIRLNHVIHHGGPGHHVQNWHAYRAPSRIGRIAAVDCASRIALSCGGTMAEGWACWVTEAVSKAGGLTPLERYAEVRTRCRMAARALVDVRLHRGEITLEEAATFYEERAGMPAPAAREETVKNSMFPGAALIYLVGTDAIRALELRMTRHQGTAMDRRAFVDRFLSYGSVPVSLIAEDMLRRDSLEEEAKCRRISRVQQRSP